MAAPLPPRGCFTCGSLHHFYRECPQRTGGYRPPATGANVVPTGGTVLALPAPAQNGGSAASFSTDSGVGVRSNGYSNYGYHAGGGAPRLNFWRNNQERLDTMYNKFLADQEKETKKKEEEERLKKQKKEDERKEQWKKERQQLESEMGEKIDKKLAKVCEDVKVNRQPDATKSSSMDNELAKLRRENEDLRKTLLGEGEDDRVRKLQKEVNDLRKQVLDKSGRDDEMTALRHEIEQLRESTVKEQEIAGLKRLIEQLKTETLHGKIRL
ncbi:hypothetical protein CBR_g45427 [Chara braunii]|uniref:CCHC-type domain-containing protein n=1 Tax=Chara braunii TaxID=69332 RepID=A0A388LYH3_CHABU|nr:hypothetical protein CBR_g45427 [Chara braunii]|eukprot:GBG87368.1 hypothetical protein CBR_g45427 [Chara braunii]